MMSGLEDFASFYVESTYNYKTLNTSGPVYEGLPLTYCPIDAQVDPWFKNKKCVNDFILIAEFSEIVGPVPLITIPIDGGKGFSLDEFAVRLLSTDHQHGFNVDFELVEDSQELLSLSEEGLYAYVHHFTLYDSYARGYVRPFCLSYVSPDEGKLSNSFTELSREFSRVSQMFKDGNLLVFFQDMTHYLSDLRYTKDKLLEREKRLAQHLADDTEKREKSFEEEEKVLKMISMGEVEKCIAEARDILNSLTTLLEKRSAQGVDFIRPAAKASNIGVTPLNKENFKLSKMIHSETLDSKLILDDSSPQEEGHDISRVSDFLDSYDTYKPELRRAGRRSVQKSLRTLEELCRKSASDALEQLYNLHKFFKRDHSTLLLEKEDLKILEPACSLLTIGRTIHLNFLSGFQKVSGRCPMNPARSCSLICSPNSSMTSKRPSSEDVTSFRTCSSVDSFESCYSESHKSDAISLVSNTSASKDSSECENAASRQENVLELSTETVISSSNSAGYSDLGSTRPQSLDIAGVDKQRRSFDLTAVDVTQHHCSHRGEVPVISMADHVENINDTAIGSGVLNFVKRHSFSPHLIFSLLCGRPVIVQGSNSQEKLVRETIQTLWAFVPGYVRNSVIPCSSTVPTLADLQNIKLYGLVKTFDKKSANLTSLEKFVTVFYLEKKSLAAPKYQGIILNEMCSVKSSYASDKAYIAYIHSKLYDLALKACLYFHGFSMKRSASMADRIEDVLEQDDWETASQAFCAKLNLEHDDALIVKYLVAVVKTQQMQEIDAHQKSEHNVGSTMVARMTLDQRKCSKFM